MPTGSRMFRLPARLMPKTSQKESIKKLKYLKMPRMTRGNTTPRTTWNFLPSLA